MKKIVFVISLTFVAICCCAIAQGQAPDTLRVVFIRHGEKPLTNNGQNLSCIGLNRSLKLPPVLYSKFKIPNYVLVPALGLGDSTKQSRMFQTISPFAIQYNLQVNTRFKEKAATSVAAYIKGLKGTVLLVWEHTSILPIVQALGVTTPHLKWHSKDFDSIWIVTFVNGGPPVFSTDKEGLNGQSSTCPF